jgi:hypothetical protein
MKAANPKGSRPFVLQVIRAHLAPVATTVETVRRFRSHGSTRDPRDQKTARRWRPVRGILARR